MDNTEKPFLRNDRFQVQGHLGAGGMGEVYQAYDKKTNEMVALKTLGRFDAKNIERFRKEFFILKDVDHPNLITLKEFFEEESQCFFSMEFVEGKDFLSCVRHSDNKLNEIKLREILGQLATGIAFLHRIGKVHRDIKPSNILVTNDNRVVILDFGIVTEVIAGRQLGDIEMTGTAAYMSPEQSMGMPVDASVDWYSMGVLLYQALFESLPYEGSPFRMRIDRQSSDPKPPTHNMADTPSDLVSLCMDLLRYEPKARPRGREILERLKIDHALKEMDAVDGVGAEIYIESIPYVGRVNELGLLHDAFDQNRLGHEASVLILGDPGLGKTALAREFTTQSRKKHENLVVLSGRCVKNSVLSFQAFDTIVAKLADQLHDLLKMSPEGTAQAKEADAKIALTPEEASAVIHVFPILSQIKTIIDTANIEREKPNPGRVRTRAFQAVRKLLQFVALQCPLILFIDDLQWAKVDSLNLLQDVMFPGGGPPLFLIATMRSDSKLQYNMEQMLTNLRRMPLDGLLYEDAAQLVGELCRFYKVSCSTEQMASLIKEASGYPLFLTELVRHMMTEGDINSTLLEDVLWSRVQRLDKDTRKLLELISLAGVALDYEIIADAADLKKDDCIRSISHLITKNLVRSSREYANETIEPYHDRVHEIVTSRLDAATKRKHHKKLAYTLGIGASGIDQALVVRHLEAAGSTQEAGQMAAQAASIAADSLAFGQAVDLLQTALRLGEHKEHERQKILMALGNALCNIGRGSEAAKAYLEARQGADIATSFELWRRSSEQLILAGHFKEGFEEIRLLLSQIGERFLENRMLTLFALLWKRMILKLRGLKWLESLESDIDAMDLVRLDVYQSVSQTMGMVDNIWGANYQARCLLAAIRIGEERRLGHALVMESIFLMSQGSSATLRRARNLLELAKNIATKYSFSNLKGFVTAGEAGLRYFEGYLQEAGLLFLEAENAFIGNADGSTNQLNNTRIFRILALKYIGDFEQLRESSKRYIRDAARRGDKYMDATIRYLRSNVWLVIDQPEKAKRDLSKAIWSPPEEGGYHLQNWYETQARAEIALYQGTICDQMDGFETNFRIMEKSLLLRVGVLRAGLGWLRGRILLASAAVSSNRKAGKLLRKANRLTKKLTHKKTGFRQAEIWSLLLRAAIADQQGERKASIAYLKGAIIESEEKDSPQLAAAARRRLGQILGGPEGAEIKGIGDDWMKEKGVVNLESMTEVFAPGFASIRQ